MCTSQNRWSYVARQMNFHDAQTGRVLKQHYEKLLLVYDVYETGIYGEQSENNNTDTKKPVTGERLLDLR